MKIEKPIINSSSNCLEKGPLQTYYMEVIMKSVTGVNRGIERILQLFCIAILLGSVAGFVLGVGCTRVIPPEKPVPGEVWKCDPAADDAMKREDYKTAILLHQRFLEKEPSNALSLYHLGYAYGQLGNHSKEASYYEKAIALGFKQQGVLFNLGMAYGELNQIEKAIDAFKKAVQTDPDNADNHFGLALSYQRSLADELAEHEFLKAIAIDPNHVDARLYLSLLYADMGELQKAAEQLRIILDIDPTHTDAREFLERIEGE